MIPAVVARLNSAMFAASNGRLVNVLNGQKNVSLQEPRTL